MSIWVWLGLAWLLVVVFALALCKLANDDREDI